MTKTVVTRALAAGFVASLLTSAAVLAAPFGLVPASGSDSTTQATPVQMHMGPNGGPQGGPMMGPGRANRGGEERVDHVEGRIAFLKAELKITAAQSKQWEAVAKAMRDQSAAMKTLHEQRPQRDRAERDRALSAPETLTQREEAMNQMAQAMAVRATGEKQFAAAFVPLYNQLSDEQKKTADGLLNRHGHGYRR